MAGRFPRHGSVSCGSVAQVIDQKDPILIGHKIWTYLGLLKIGYFFYRYTSISVDYDHVFPSNCDLGDIRTIFTQALIWVLNPKRRMNVWTMFQNVQAYTSRHGLEHVPSFIENDTLRLSHKDSVNGPPRWSCPSESSNCATGEHRYI